jgi:hypothetical protein
VLIADTALTDTRHGHRAGAVRTGGTVPGGGAPHPPFRSLDPLLCLWASRSAHRLQKECRWREGCSPIREKTRRPHACSFGSGKTVFTFGFSGSMSKPVGGPGRIAERTGLEASWTTLEIGSHGQAAQRARQVATPKAHLDGASVGRRA